MYWAGYGPAWKYFRAQLRLQESPQRSELLPGSDKQREWRKNVANSGNPASRYWRMWRHKATSSCLGKNRTWSFVASLSKANRRAESAQSTSIRGRRTDFLQGRDKIAFSDGNQKYFPRRGQKWWNFILSSQK